MRKQWYLEKIERWRGESVHYLACFADRVVRSGILIDNFMWTKRAPENDPHYTSTNIEICLNTNSIDFYV